MQRRTLGTREALEGILEDAATPTRAFASDYGYDLVSLLLPGMNCAPIVGRCLLGYRLRPRWTLSGIPPGCVHRVVSGVVWCSSG